MATKGRNWVKAILIAIIGIFGFCTLVLGLAYIKQEEIVRHALDSVNESFQGKIEVGGSHISPFKNFPYISIDLEDLRIYYNKTDSEEEPMLMASDAYVGFNVASILSGDFNIKSIIVSDATLKLVQYEDGSLNIEKAFSGSANEAAESDGGGMKWDLNSIRLQNVDLLKYNEANGVLVEAFIQEASSSYQLSDSGMEIALSSSFLFNLIVKGDTSFLHDKQVQLQTAVTLDSKKKLLSIDTSKVFVAGAEFSMAGLIDIGNDMYLDLIFQGRKSNFDLFLAFAPPELAPVLTRYENGGSIYVDARVKGPSIHGYNPQIEVDFGCSQAFIENLETGEEIDELFFKGHFTNGELRNPRTMELTVKDFSAQPETGEFEGEVSVKNFDSPEIDMKILSKFDLDFLAKFLNLNNLKDVTGSVSLELNFHDIIDLDEPEKSLERLNESYFTRLEVKDLNFREEGYPLAVSDVNIRAFMDGNKASIDQFDFKVGSSDIAIKAQVSDLPAIIHHTDIPVDASLDIRSTLIDLKELTLKLSDSTAVINEEIRDLAMQFSFNSSARAFTESPNLPMGEFMIENLEASFANYPHRLQEFNAEVLIDEKDFRVIDFSGLIDKSDFHFNGVLENYDLWFAENPKGSTQIDFNVDSDLIRLEDLFSYGGENYVPEDYRHEEFRDVRLHGVADMSFDQKLLNTIVEIDKLGASMNIHPMRFEDFSGVFYLDSTQFKVSGFGGKLGNSTFRSDLVYYLGAESGNTHSISLIADKLDFDQLFAWNPPPESSSNANVDHESGFNIFEVPFLDMDFSLEVGKLTYHRYLLDDFSMSGRIQEDHFAYLDTLHFDAAGGQVRLNGYFNGTDPKMIYFSPYLELQAIDLDKLLFKFENFGQDQLVSENLHGNISGTLEGKIHMHPDMVPSIDDSQLEMHFSVVNGSLNDFAAFEALSDYFTDKNLKNVRFDTLRNDLYLDNGVLRIPSMNINSTLGYFEISGTQSVDLEMEYFVRIPVKVVAKAGFQKLFTKKGRDNSDQVDEIQYRDESSRTRFVNVKIEGTADDYDVSIGKDK